MADGLIDKALSRITEIDAQIGPLEKERARLRSFVNQAYELDGQPPMFPEDEPSATAASGSGGASAKPQAPLPASGRIPVKADEFFHMPLAAAARKYMEMRRLFDMGPASTEDIHDALVRGGYGFPGSDLPEQRRGLQVSLTKNSQTFAKLPNGLYGLKEWY